MNWLNVCCNIDNGEKVIADIEYCKIYMNGNVVNIERPVDNLDPVGYLIETIEYLYEDYKNSIPKKINDDSKYFKAKSYEELTLKDLVNGKDRYKARQKLESFIVFIKAFRKEDILDLFGDRFFWQSEEDPELILLRSWFE